MDELLVRTVLIRYIIEHRFVGNGLTMAQAITWIAKESDLSPRYVNMVLIGDKRSASVLDTIENTITRLSDGRGSVPHMCCTPEAVDNVKLALAQHYMQGGE